jgi:DNA adenine methylase
VTAAMIGTGRRSPINYHGSKGRLAPWIASLLPAHRTYLEPFFGSGAVLFAKPPSPTEIVNDLDANVTTFFKVLRERPDELARACRLTPYARAEFTVADLTDPTVTELDEVERARRFFVRINQSVGKTTRASTGWAVAPHTGGHDHAHKFAALTDRLVACAERLRRVHIEQRPAVEVIARFATSNAVVYADPPYLAATRSSLTRRRGADYAVEYATEAQHRELAAVLRVTPAVVLLSGYPSDLYEELYGDWWRLKRSVDRPSSHTTGGRGPRAVEVIWANRPLPTQLAFTDHPTDQATDELEAAWHALHALDPLHHPDHTATPICEEAPE